MSAPSSARPALGAYWRLVRGHRPIGIWLLLWPTLWGLWLAAEGPPEALTLAVFAVGVVLMRSAGCAINDYADRDIDGHVERTRDRPLPANELTPRAALATAAALALAAFALTWLLNPLTVALAVVGAALAGVYPFMKRWIAAPQLVLGCAFAWGVPMGFAAVRGELPASLWLAWLATLTWTVAYDTLYAMADREDDLKIGVRSTAVLFGRFELAACAALQLLTLALLVGAGMAFGLGGAFYLGLGAAALLFAAQLRQARGRDREGCLKAFQQNHYVGLAVFAGIALDYSLA